MKNDLAQFAVNAGTAALVYGVLQDRQADRELALSVGFAAIGLLLLVRG